MKNNTSIIIAHRFSTIRNCDKIILINDGNVCESGNFDYLMNKKQIFYQMYDV